MYTFQVTTQASCAWTATSDRPWIQVLTPSGQGSGSLQISVQPPPYIPIPQSGNLYFMGQSCHFFYYSP